MTAEFDRDVAVTATGEGTYAADLSPGWVVGGGVNGGYLLAVLGRALGGSTVHPDPLTVSAYYLSASRPGPATVTTRLLRESGSTATMAADLVQEGGHRIAALATYGDLGSLPDDVGTTATEPELPPLEECWGMGLAPPDFRASAPPLLSRFDLRFDPATAGWAVGQPSGRGLIQGWFRLNDDREPDPVSLLLAVDAMPPVTFDLGRMGWAPTLELTVHVRARPAPGWLKLRHETRNLAGGMFEEDCEVWDSAGRLVAQSRQLARQPRPPR
ncbi:thioesterase family protein [Nocardioides cynanchi]|uniref:thioesterase family protein n=1 Tax=Nocardioides cynanchi TaxID=2558918 RepID=UPI001245B6AB|nr:thioesterase family protein [Nocardioides cynanchi]